ncbi:MAG: trigger factor [Bacteroidetes bacterium]|nr:MAG: trigger factor [Bacteroidota bacterium]
MLITKENTGTLTATLKVEIVESDYIHNVEEQLKDYRKKANIPGFRAGKVPLGIIKKMYGKAITANEVNKLLSQKITAYLEEEKINIIGEPLPNMEKTPPMDLDHKKDFTYYFDLGLKPDITIALDQNTAVTYTSIAIEEDKVDEYIDHLLKRNGTTVEVESVEEGDLLKCDFQQLDEEGEVLEGGIQHSASLSLEEIQLKTIKKKFIGKTVGSIVKFDPMHAIKNATDVAAMLNIEKEEAENLKATFATTITGITRHEKAEMNEELFKKVYPQDEIADETALRERIKKDIAISYSSESDRHFLNNCIDALIEKTDIELPVEFLKRWIMATNEEKITEEQLESQMDSFTKSLRWNLIEKELTKDYPELAIKEEDIRDHIKGLFPAKEEESEEDKERMEMIMQSLLQNQEQVKSIHDHLLEQRLTSILKNNLNVVEEEVSYDAFSEMIAQIHAQKNQ